MALLLSGGVARGQQSEVAAFQAFTNSSFYAGLIDHALDGLPADVFHRCPTLVSNSSQVRVFKAPTFGTDGYPNSGLWKQSFPVSGCGNDTTLNFYFKANGNEKIDTIIAFPGSTRADLVLQNDAFKYAVIAATSKTGCKALNVKTTAFIDDGANPGADLKPWSETWTLVGCGHLYTVPLTFIPDATGGTDIVSKPSDVVTH